MDSLHTVKLPANALPFTTEVVIHAFEPQYPIVQNASAIVYRERFMQIRASYVRPLANTPHPHIPNVYFAEDVDFQDRMNGIVEWTRVYTTIPNQWTDFESYAYTFPGYVSIRVPLSRTVTAKLTKDFFIVGTLPTYQNNLAGTPDNIASWPLVYVTATPNATNIPICAGGTNAASLLLAVTPSQEHYAIQGTPIAANSNVAGAIFVKPNTTNRVTLMIRDNAGTTNFAQSNFDLTNHSVKDVLGTGTLQAIGDGWFRLCVQGYANTAGCCLTIGIANATGALNYSPTNESIWAWRAQLVPNTNIPHATVAPTATPDGGNYPVQSADLVPVKFGQLYLYNWAANVAAEFLSGATTPTLANYQANVNTDQNAANVNSYSIEATDSALKHWQGTIWERTRTFVKAR